MLIAVFLVCSSAGESGCSAFVAMHTSRLATCFERHLRKIHARAPISECVLRVCDRNPNMNEMLLLAQTENPFSLIEWGATRWNTKVDAMKRFRQLNAVINYVVDGTVKRILPPERRRAAFYGKGPSLSDSVFVSQLTILQQDDAVLVAAFRQVRQLQAHLASCSADPALQEALCRTTRGTVAN